VALLLHDARRVADHHLPVEALGAGALGGDGADEVRVLVGMEG
jgi:hypothetical protein